MTPAAAILALLALAPPAALARDEGAVLYDTNCSSCHGIRGEGSNVAPPLIGKSAAAVHFMMDTGRMPAAVPGVNEIPRPPRFTQRQIDQIVTHVMSLAGERSRRSLPMLQAGNVKHGGELYSENCAQCHGAVGDGASVGANNVAPNLATATAFQIAEAVRVGPGIMPRFGTKALSDRDVDDIAAYVKDVETRAGDLNGANSGGLPLAHIGPAAEGFVAWFFGMGALLLFIRAIGTAGNN
ncbi:MAG: c-type cytochrome [Candidatus Eremiobacteraeota bacterium]|nr:c-type cytochrome [Candidatus Eremiobacteraeota bacterium]